MNQNLRIKKEPAHIISRNRILAEIPELERQGYKCIPIDCGVIPDMIAMKDGKLYAVEVEYGKPRYDKYVKNGYKKYFTNIIWILRNRKNQKVHMGKDKAKRIK